jgi:hypothetical protein
MQINSHTSDRGGSRIGTLFKSDAVRLLSFYQEAPQEELTLDEFELFSLDRLQLLRGIETLRTKGYEGNELETKMSQVCTLSYCMLSLKSLLFLFLSIFNLSSSLKL